MGQQLSDTESLLWSLGRDPNLASTMGLVAVIAGKPDPQRVRATVTATVAEVDRLQQRVVSPTVTAPGGALARPMWVTDDRFDLDHHFRVVRLGAARPATDAELRQHAAQFINDPFDLTRPLWQFQLVVGLAKGRSALLGKVHHSISDGIGLLQLAATLLEFEADRDPPDPVDLEQLMGQRFEQEQQSPEADRSPPERLLSWLQSTAQGLPDPKKLVEAGAEAVASVRTVSRQLPKTQSSALWSTRSRNRRLEFQAIPLQPLRARADELGVTINDLFVASCAQAAVHYHREMGAELPSITATVVVSTHSAAGDRDDDRDGDRDGEQNQDGERNRAEDGGLRENAFIPVAIELPGHSANADERLELVRSQVWEHRRRLQEKGDPLGLIGSLGGLVPSSVAASLAVQQAAKVDFATSNIPGPPMPTWLAATPIDRIYPVGPVAGTAFNVTLMSYDQEALFGIHLDPAAVTDGNLLKLSLGRGFGDFGVSRR